jgi:hypothetical protein
VPGAAAGLADVGAGDPHPLVILRGVQHLAQQLAVVTLDQRSLRQRLARLGDPVGEAVADRLQLAEIKHPGDGRQSLDPVGNLGVAKGIPEETRQLHLESGDLLAQLQPRLTLVDRDVEPGETVFQRSGHHRKCNHAASRVAAAIHKASSTAICGTPFTWTAATAIRRLLPLTL